MGTERIRSSGLVLWSLLLLASGCTKDDEVVPEGAVAHAPPNDQPTRDDHLALGNPSEAVASVVLADNYLMTKPQFALAYNNSRGTATWVSWHLSEAWKGSAERCDCFTPDFALPVDLFAAETSDYTNTGFDRGHMCPSDDRDGSDADNAVTFLMTNIMPQAPQMNQATWRNMEDYARDLIYEGHELYIIAGGYGSGGSGSQGGTTYTLAGGSITVPSRYWKVMVVLPVGGDDLSRVSSETRVIAVDMPNAQTVTSLPWGSYRTSVDAIEDSTGLDLLSLVPGSLQALLESPVDNGPTQ